MSKLPTRLGKMEVTVIPDNADSGACLGTKNLNRVGARNGEGGGGDGQYPPPFWELCYKEE